jgi:hypothetical protein
MRIISHANGITVLCTFFGHPSHLSRSGVPVAVLWLFLIYPESSHNVPIRRFEFGPPPLPLLKSCLFSADVQNEERSVPGTRCGESC